MRLSALLNQESIAPALTSSSVMAAIPELLSIKRADDTSTVNQSLIEAVLRREEQGSTMIGNGVAIPHARISGPARLRLWLGRMATPLLEIGPDEVPVDLIFILVSGDRHHSLLLQAMAAVASLASNAETCRRLREADSATAMWHVVAESSVEVKDVLEARDLMSPPVFIASPDMTVATLLDRFFEYGIDEAPVCDNAGNLIGVVGARDILEAGFPDYMTRLGTVQFLSEGEPFERFFEREAKMMLSEVLNPNPLKMRADDAILEVVFRLRKLGFASAYILENDRLVGIIHRKEILSRVLRV